MEGALGLADELRIPLGDDLGHRQSRRQELVVRYHAVHETQLISPLRRDVLTQHQQFEGNLAAHHVHGMRRDRGSGQPGAQLGEPEARTFGGHDEVAAEGQAAARAQGIAVHGRDDRLVDARQELEQVDAFVGMPHQVLAVLRRQQTR